MSIKIILRLILSLAFLVPYFYLPAQDNRAQYPGLLSNAYFGVNAGSIHYPFSNQHMEMGNQAESIKVPHLALRLTLFGYRFNKNLSAQITYMRPFNWVEYKNINGDQSRHTVWMNVVGLTLKSQIPIKKRFSVFGEAGLGLITCNGFEIDSIEVVTDENYASVLLGGGLQYHLNNKWDLNISAVYSPSNSNLKQPHTLFFSGGFIFNMHPLPEERVEKNSNNGFIFPKNLVQVGYTTNELGYGVNDFVSEGAIPIFWGGESHLRSGFSINYQRNVFHSRKVFSLDVGTSFGYWKTRINKSRFYTFSIYPLLRFTALRSKQFDLYFNYSVAGPSFISRVELDGKDTGKKFTFRDFMGMGTYMGKNRNLNTEINIGHFSNGNIFPSNAGVKIPLSFNLGYTFN